MEPMPRSARARARDAATAHPARHTPSPNARESLKRTQAQRDPVQRVHVVSVVREGPSVVRLTGLTVHTGSAVYT